MTNSENIDVTFYERRMQQRVSSEKRDSPLSFSSGGGTYDGMDPRVDALENRMTRVEEKFDVVLDKLGDIKLNLVQNRSELDKQLSKLPSTFQMWSMWGVTAALAFAIMAVLVGALAVLKP